MSSPRRYCLNDLWLIDGTGAEPRRAAVLVHGGRIEAVVPEGAHSPPEAPAVSLHGGYLLPGLINAHSHLFLERSPQHLSIPETPVALIGVALFNAEAAVSRGVTTMREAGAPAGWDLQVRDLVAAGLFPGPRIVAAGRPITRTGGHLHFCGREADGPDEVRKAVREELKAGVDVVKVMSTGGYGTPNSDQSRPGFSVLELRAAVEEAHDAGLRAMSHAGSNEGIRRSLLAGVDSVEHGCVLDAETVDLFLKTGASLVPTLSTLHRMAHHGREWGRPQHMLDGAERFLSHGLRSLAMAVAAGIPMAVGSDAWGEMVLEMVLMAEAGMAPSAVLRAATSGGAEVLGRQDLGTIAEGHPADLLVVEQNPLERLEVLRSPAAVFQEGRLTFDSGRIPLAGMA